MVFRKDRSVSRGGGLAVYVNSTIRCKSLSQFVNPGNVLGMPMLTAQTPPAPQVSFVSATGCHIPSPLCDRLGQ